MEDFGHADQEDYEILSILPVVNVIPLTSRKTNRRVYPNEAVLPANGRAHS